MTVAELLAGQASRTPDRIALCAPGSRPLTYAALREHVADLAGALSRHGIARSDRVAMVLPGGPDLAVAFLAGAAAAASAPLNPAYREEELAFYLDDLRPKGLMLAAGQESAAATVAERLGIPILRVSRRLDGVAGSIEIGGGGHASTWEPPQPEDVALVLHTSGTTSRPKAVPLTQANLGASADHVRRALALTPEDRCLNIMPLFHVHGLVAGLLASLAAGASVACPPGFYAPDFFGWMAELRPTWYTAVPTMHQAILARAARHPEVIARHPLRLIRSSSASLPPSVMAELEQVFGAPVLEAYGMTEAAHQMASHPLPPGPRKPGSVGPAAGPEIAVLGPAAEPLPAGSVGEIVIRGPNVTGGYLDNPAANAEAFTAGWFHTGDQGYLDSDGYLFITGRLKELINRGGEKIAPREVEEVLLTHGGVDQAAVFAVPHPTLGEEVGAVVVPRAGRAPSDRELREHAASRLADFKIPTRILFREELPKGPTGKVQRIGLAARLGVQPAPERTGVNGAMRAEPRTPLEAQLAGIWGAVLGVDTVGVHDHFLDLGGDSLIAARLVSRIRDVLRLEVPQRALFDAPTVAEQAALIEPVAAAGSAP